MIPFTDGFWLGPARGGLSLSDANMVYWKLVRTVVLYLHSGNLGAPKPNVSSALILLVGTVLTGSPLNKLIIVDGVL